ncbi:hypothetical protein KO495_10755 [Colwellia sp. D2M02]|uniref:hypothetical protein n=1 Tax=Colwellia sp. D2M02 TaxID=2841562 RepID=UPI001C097FE2|nr:hypothetical protein [Colwellia sp. D2M02]MBU2893801.1 hypothetical protein [Colwellia sp. D2M02]
MKLYCSPDLFHLIAQRFLSFRWRLLGWSAPLLILFTLIQAQINANTPTLLVWLAFLILFSGLQLLVFSAFIWFFQQLPSKKEAAKISSEKSKSPSYWFKLYRAVEWCEAVLFFILLPMPTLIFLYAIIVVG